MTNKVYVFAGITSKQGVAKARWTNNLSRRVKQVDKLGHDRVDFVLLPRQMNKMDALRYLLAHESFQSPADQATLSEALTERECKIQKLALKLSAAAALNVVTTESVSDSFA
jgi:hypothetical protein